MRTRIPFTAIALVLALGMGVTAVSMPVHAADKKEKPPSVSPKVGKPLQEAQKLVADKKFPEALAKLQEVQKISGKSPYEEYATDDMLGFVYVNMQDFGNAAAAFDASYASGAMPADMVNVRLKAITQLYYQAKNYPKAAEAGMRYVKTAGPDTEVEMLVGQAYYIQKDYKNASDTFHDALKQNGDKTPKEEWLQLAMSADYEQGNGTAVMGDLGQLVTYYPQPKYWQDLISIVEKNIKDKSPKTSLDIYRVMFATGVMQQEPEYMEMANTAMQQGLPGEAKKVLDKGFSTGVLGKGPQKDAATKLQAQVNTAAETDQKQLASGAAEADKQKTGDADVRFGEAYWSYGQYDKAAELIQRGISKGVKDKDDAELRLGMAYLGAGKRPQALEAFKQIPPESRSGQIATLWTIESGAKQTASAQ